MCDVCASVVQRDIVVMGVCLCRFCFDMNVDCHLIVLNWAKERWVTLGSLVSV